MKLEAAFEDILKILEPKGFFKRTRKFIKKYLSRSLFQKGCRLLVSNVIKSDFLNMILTWILQKLPTQLF